jgi:hypothetical protein
MFMGLIMLGGLKDMTAKPLLPELSASEVKIAIDKLKKYVTRCQILAELIQAGGRTVCSVIRKCINSFWNEEKLAQQWKE